MNQKPTILIVDRNPHVREYLKRELGCDDYHLYLAENCRELFQMLEDKPKLDLIIIDPDLPDAEEKRLLRRLQSIQSGTPLVIHTFVADYLNPCSLLFEAVLVEKDGNSIERLKHAVARQLDVKRAAPGRHCLETASGAGWRNKTEARSTLENVIPVDREND